MNIEKLPSGSYRVRKQINGKMVRITFDHKPSEDEILMAFSKHINDASFPQELLTFSNAAKQYVEMKRNVLSPRTVKEYIEAPSRLSQEFVSLNIYEITANDVQREVNRLAKNKSPKTVKNYHSFISSVIRAYRQDAIWRITLPQPIKKEPYIPSDDEVKRFLEYIKTERPRYYVLVVLAAYGLRRSEIMAISKDDLDGTTLHITKAKVLDENNNWIIKTTKTPRSRRDIEIPKDIADLIRKQEYAFEYHPGDVSKVINTACKRLGINRFTLHKLRHYFATKLLSENVDIMTVVALGGWSSPAMLNNRYAHAVEEKKKKALVHIDNIIS